MVIYVVVGASYGLRDDVEERIVARRLLHAVDEQLHGVDGTHALEHAPQRISGIVSVELLTDGPMREGTRWKETRKMMGKEATETMWITRFDPPRCYVAEAESCGTHYVSTLSFEQAGGGTRVTMSFEGRPVTLLAKLLSAPMGWMMKGAVRKMIAQDLADLGAHLEQTNA